MRFLWELAPVPHPSSTRSCPAAGSLRSARLSLILALSGALGPKVAGPCGTSSAGWWRRGQPGSQACLASVFPGEAEWGILAWRAHDSQEGSGGWGQPPRGGSPPSPPLSQMLKMSPVASQLVQEGSLPSPLHWSSLVTSSISGALQSRGRAHHKYTWTAVPRPRSPTGKCRPQPGSMRTGPGRDHLQCSRGQGTHKPQTWDWILPLVS